MTLPSLSSLNRLLKRFHIPGTLLMLSLLLGAPQSLTGWAEHSAPYFLVPGTHVSIQKPEGFTEAVNFTGLLHADKTTTIMVTELPAPFSKIAQTMTAGRLSSKGMTLVSRDHVLIDHISGILVNVTQTTQGVSFSKWIAVFGNDQKTVTITASFLKSKAPAFSSLLRNTLLSAHMTPSTAVKPSGSKKPCQLSKKPTEDPSAPAKTSTESYLNDIRYQIKPVSTMKLATRFQKNLLYTQEGEIPSSSPEKALFTLGPSLFALTIGDRKDFAIRRMEKINEIKELEVQSVEPVLIDHLDGYEITGEARDKSSHLPVNIYMVMLFEADRYYLMVGIVGKNNTVVSLEDFKLMANSFQRK